MRDRWGHYCKGNVVEGLCATGRLEADHIIKRRRDLPAEPSIVRWGVEGSDSTDDDRTVDDNRRLQAVLKEVGSEIAQHYGFDLAVLRRVARSKSRSRIFKAHRDTIARIAHACLRNEWARDGEIVTWPEFDALCFYEAGHPLPTPSAHHVAELFTCAPTTIERLLESRDLSEFRTIIGTIRPTLQKRTPSPQQRLFERVWPRPQTYKRVRNGRQSLR
jgi:hypothetical protein